MTDEQHTEVRLFPQGMFTLAMAVLLERSAYYLLASGLILGLADSLELGPSSAGNIWIGFVLVSALLAVPGGLIADRAGHRKSMIIGLALCAGGVLALFVASDGHDGMAWLGSLFGLLTLAAGRALFPVSVMVALSNLCERGEHRVPAAGAFTLLHVCANVAALLVPYFKDGLAHLFLNELNFDFGGMRNVTSLVSVQLLIIALIVVAGRGQVLRAALDAVREKIAAKDTSAPDDGSARYRSALLGIVLVAWFVFMIGYGQSFAVLGNFMQRFGDGTGVAFGHHVRGINPAVIVFLAPVAIIVYGRLRNGGRPVPLALLMAIGMAVVAVGLFVMVAASLNLIEDPYEFAPKWGSARSSTSWPGVSLFVVALGEILVVPLMPLIVTSVAPRRMKGLLYGAALAVGGVAGIGGSFVLELTAELPLWVEFALLGSTALFGAVFIGVFIKSMRLAKSAGEPSSS